MGQNFNFSIKAEIGGNPGAALKKAAIAAMKTTAAELDGRFTDAISQAVWPWPRESKRGVGGSTVGERAKQWANKSFNTGTPRSIVDSGELKQSKVFNVNGLKAEWMWTANYAAAIHEGARIHPWGNPKNGTVNLPARPWTDAVLVGGTSASIPVFDFTEVLTKNIQKNLR